MKRSPYIPVTFDELRAAANGQPVRCVHARVLMEEIVRKMEKAAEFRGRYAAGYVGAMAEVLDLLMPDGG